jgi:hypothetical protein
VRSGLQRPCLLCTQDITAFVFGLDILTERLTVPVSEERTQRVRKRILRQLLTKEELYEHRLKTTRTAIKTLAPFFWKAEGYLFNLGVGKRLRDAVFTEDEQC